MDPYAEESMDNEMDLLNHENLKIRKYLKLMNTCLNQIIDSHKSLDFMHGDLL